MVVASDITSSSTAASGDALAPMSLPQGFSMNDFVVLHAFELSEPVRVPYGANVLVMDSDGHVAACYVAEVLTCKDQNKLLPLMKAIFKDGKMVPRGLAIGSKKFKTVMGGFRECLGNKPQFVFGPYTNTPEVIAKQFEFAQLLCWKLGSNKYFGAFFERFFQQAMPYLVKGCGHGLIPFTPITSVSMTCNFESNLHLDEGDGLAGTMITWVDEVNTQLGVGKHYSAEFQLATAMAANNSITILPMSGSVLWLDSSKLYHGSMPVKVYGNDNHTGADISQNDCFRYGSAIFCKPQVLQLGVHRYEERTAVHQELKARGLYAKTRSSVGR
jgi:hypothetical protein